MKTIIVIIILAVAIVVVVLALRRSGRKQGGEITYAELKALPRHSKDFTTPEGAILCLEDAYRRRDIEAAVACKDFITEAKLMLQKFDEKVRSDPEILKETAETLELAYRKEMSQSWPDFANLESFFTDKQPYAEKVVMLTEVCRFPDGLTSRQQILVGKTAKGWRVLNPVYE
jgi:hypothetical protein